MLTVLTGIWELSFILNYKKTENIAINMLLNKEHVWTNKYNISYIIPWKLSKIFYADYAAYADREYMLLNDDWYRIIEGSHALFCGLFALIALNRKIVNDNSRYMIAASVSMGSQLMNSILYLSEYFRQINDIESVNYNNPDFPCGFLLIKRPFMYVNIF